MIPLLVLIIVIAIAFWLGKEYSYARRRQTFLATRDSRGRPMLPPHKRVSEESLQARAAQLRAAVHRGDINHDEAVGSLLRYAGTALSVEGAERLMRS